MADDEFDKSKAVLEIKHHVYCMGELLRMAHDKAKEHDIDFMIMYDGRWLIDDKTGYIDLGLDNVGDVEWLS